MTHDENRSEWSAGCAAVLAAGVILLLCGGGFVALVGGGYYLAQRQAVEARQLAIDAREQALIAAMRSGGGTGETPLPLGAHVVAIGPDGELFWDNQAVDLARLEQTLAQLAPASQRGAIPVFIRPGIGAPEEMSQRVEDLAAGYEVVVEPPPISQIRLAPEPGDGRPPANVRPKK